VYLFQICDEKKSSRAIYARPGFRVLRINILRFFATLGMKNVDATAGE
jgi:hypothetical protein